MKNNLQKRKNLRIPKYDYSSEGLYFLTICTKDRKCILSEIINNERDEYLELKLLPYGKIIEKYLKQINNIYDYLKIEDYVIMPNHIHFVCEITENTLLEKSNPTKSRIPVLISTLKRLVNKECSIQIWQRNYYEHIIRNEKEYLAILEYITNNPYNWEKDKYHE